MESQSAGGAARGAAARRPFFRRRKSCPFSGPNAPKIDYKDVKLLQRFVSERGKIVPSRITAVSTKKQRELAAGDQAGAVSRPAALYGEVGGRAAEIGMGRLGFVGIAVLCGALGALPYLLALNGSPGSLILVYLTQLPLFVAGLWLGAAAALLAGLTAALLLLAASEIMAAALFVGLFAAPTVLLVRQALLARAGTTDAVEWYPPGLLTAWLTGFGLAGIAVALYFLGGPDGIRSLLHEVLAPALGELVGEKAAEREALLEFLALVMPGVVASSWMVMAVSNGSLAQGVLARFGANWRPSPDIAALSLPIWIPALLALAAIATMFGGAVRYVGINVMIVLGVPFCLGGLAVLHTLARRLPRPAVLLVCFYVVAALFGWPLLLIALLGVLDSSLGLRRRIAPQRSLGGRIDG